MQYGSSGIVITEYIRDYPAIIPETRIYGSVMINSDRPEIFGGSSLRKNISRDDDLTGCLQKYVRWEVVVTGEIKNRLSNAREREVRLARGGEPGDSKVCRAGNVNRSGKTAARTSPLGKQATLASM